MTFAELSPESRCPCQSGETYGECCSPFHAGTAVAPTAERLMRSRYSAYVVGNADYLRATWHSSTRPATLEIDPDIRWFALDITGRTGGGMFDSTGTVAFVASFRVSGTRGEQNENSRFVKERKQWFYVDAL